MKLDRAFRERGQGVLLAAGLACFIGGYFTGVTAKAVLDMAFSLCVFGIILLEIICRRRRPGQPVWTKKAKMNIAFAGLYCLVFALHMVLVLMELRLPVFVRTMMNLTGSVSLMALLIHDWKSGRRRSRADEK